MSSEPTEKPSEKKLKNLIPFKKNDPRTKRLQSKGGKSKSAKKAVANALRKRKWCEPKCSMYFSCPFVNMSQKQYEGRCALKKQDAKVQGMIVDLLLDPDKIIDNMKRVLADMSWEALGSFKNKAVLFDKLKDLYETVHAKKISHDITGGSFTVVIKEPKVLQETKAKKEKKQAEDSASQT